MPKKRSAQGSGGKDKGASDFSWDTAKAHTLRELINRGADLLEAGGAKEAIPLLERALELDPDNIDAAINLGGAYILTGQHRRAVPILERASELEPANPMVWTNLAAAYLDRLPYHTREGEEKAIAAFERALEINPATPNVSYNLGLIFKDRGDLEEAIAHFERAIQTNPADKDARYWRDRLMRALEKGAGEDAGPAGQGAEE